MWRVFISYIRTISASKRSCSLNKLKLLGLSLLSSCIFSHKQIVPVLQMWNATAIAIYNYQGLTFKVFLGIQLASSWEFSVALLNPGYHKYYTYLSNTITLTVANYNSNVQEIQQSMTRQFINNFKMKIKAQQIWLSGKT
jgi:hypothetical protein